MNVTTNNWTIEYEHLDGVVPLFISLIYNIYRSEQEYSYDPLGWLNLYICKHVHKQLMNKLIRLFSRVTQINISFIHNTLFASRRTSKFKLMSRLTF
jgi:hypothetical protein